MFNNPPEGLPVYIYNANSGIKTLEDFLVTKNYLNKYWLLCGEFNARTGILNNYLTSSAEVPEIERFYLHNK